MRTTTLKMLATMAVLIAFVATAQADEDKPPMDDGSGAASEDPPLDEEKEPAPVKEPEVVGYEESDTNTDYVPKSDVEGSTWTFDPQKVELTTGQSDTGTNFQGARILKGNEDVVVQGAPAAGVYGDESTRYGYWQGSTYFFGVSAEESGNSVDAIAEFFWFESSIPRGSDFYVMQLKVKSSPNVWDKWLLAKDPNFIDDYIFFWNDVQPSQHVDVVMEAGGQHGALRWDFCVPFETYKWEPLKTMQIKESYGAGYSLTGTANGKGKASKQFKEGGAVADLTADASIQAKGYINNDFKVQSQYTITLYKWQMLVQSGGQDIHYKMVVLPHDEDQNQEESGYYEYFIVMQATRGTPVHVDEIEIGGMFRKSVPLWFDPYEGISATVGDIWITPPRGVCLPGDIAPAGTCNSKGVCGVAAPECVNNQWVCPVMDVYEQIEVSCDGLDNDCDGVVDEAIERECSTACGGGYELCIDGRFEGCDAIAPQKEICGDGVDNDCDGTLDNGCTEEPPVNDDPNNPSLDPPTDPGKGNEVDDGKDGSTDTNPWHDDDNNGSSDTQQYTPPSSSPKTGVPEAGTAGCTTATQSPAPAGGLMLLMMMAAVLAARRRQ